MAATFEEICNIFDIDKKSQPGVYFPRPSDAKIHIPLGRRSIYSYMQYEKLLKKLPPAIMVEPVVTDNEKKFILTIYTADRLLIYGGKGNTFYLSSHLHNCFQFPIFDSDTEYTVPDTLKNCYLSYDECLEHCIDMNYLHDYCTDPYILHWLSLSKIVNSVNERLVKYLQHYLAILETQHATGH